MILSLRGIKCYYGLIPALKGISLNVGQGEIVALLGANGAGKTTTLKAIMSAVHKEGIVEFEGQKIEKLKTERIVRLGIAIVPENRKIFPELTII
jgi:branched-chain amino acid transport system ATP-binding protein